jgi:hypothetical protein
MGLGSEIRDMVKTYSGSWIRVQESKRHRNPDFGSATLFFPVLSDKEILRFCLVYCILIINFFQWENDEIYDILWFSGARKNKEKFLFFFAVFE